MVHIQILLPEIFVIFWLIILLISFSLVTHKSNFIIFNNKKYVPLVFSPVWVTLFLLSIFYFILLLHTPSTFYTIYGIYSNTTVYCIRLILSLLFIVYMLYLKVEVAENTKHPHSYSFEFYIVLFFSFVSLNLILISCTLLNLFIFIELLSLCLYFLFMMNKKSPKTVEAALKYFIFGSTSSSFLLFGFYLLYFRTGCNDLFDILLLTYNNDYFREDYIYFLACSFISLSLLFKVGASFFFFWMVDVYDGAGYPLLIYLNSFLKVVYIFKLFQFLACFNLIYLELGIKAIILLSLVFGLFGALYQIKTKKFLIFTSIYNISFFSIVFWNFSNEFLAIFLLYIFFYIFNSMLFTILFASIKDWHTNLTIKNLYNLVNLRSQNPALVFFFIAYSFIVAGLPPSILFLLKFSIFFEISRQLSFFWLIFFLLISTLSFFLYVRLVKLLLKNDENPTIFLKPIPGLISYMLSFSLFLNIYLILFFDKIIIYVSLFANGPFFVV